MEKKKQIFFKEFPPYAILPPPGGGAWFPWVWAGLSDSLPKYRVRKGEKSNFYRETWQCYLNQIVKINITSYMSCWYCISFDITWWEEHFTHVVFFPKTHNPNVIMRKYKCKLKDILQISHQYSSKLLRLWKIRKDWED